MPTVAGLRASVQLNVYSMCWNAFGTFQNILTYGKLELVQVFHLLLSYFMVVSGEFLITRLSDVVTHAFNIASYELPLARAAGLRLLTTVIEV